jgi:hypothetical protein
MMKAVRREKDRMRSEIVEGIAEYREAAAEYAAERRREERVRSCGTLACEPGDLWRYLALILGTTPVPLRDRTGPPAFLH